MKTVLLWCFIGVMAADLLIPYLLAPTYTGYSHRTMVMSSLGNPSSPVRGIYNVWLVVGGILFILGAWTLYTALSESSNGLSVSILVLQVAFALGAMILSGIFSVGETKEMDTLASKIHGIGSSLGFMALLAVPLLLTILSGKQGDGFGAILSGICFVLALGAFILFIMADKPVFAGSLIAQEGTWQRLTLLFMYCPVVYHCALQIRNT